MLLLSNAHAASGGKRGPQRGHCVRKGGFPSETLRAGPSLSYSRSMWAMRGSFRTRFVEAVPHGAARWRRACGCSGRSRRSRLTSPPRRWGERRLASDVGAEPVTVEPWTPGPGNWQAGDNASLIHVGQVPLVRRAERTEQRPTMAQASAAGQSKKVHCGRTMTTARAPSLYEHPYPVLCTWSPIPPPPSHHCAASPSASCRQASSCKVAGLKQKSPFHA